MLEGNTQRVWRVLAACFGVGAGAWRYSRDRSGPGRWPQRVCRIPKTCMKGSLIAFKGCFRVFMACSEDASSVFLGSSQSAARVPLTCSQRCPQ